MPNSNNKSTDFTEQPFFIGIDVHKKSWTVTVRTLDIEVSHFTQEPDAKQLAPIAFYIADPGRAEDTRSD